MITTDNLANALQLALKAHQGQTRKFNGEPYINHPLRVQRTLAEAGASENVLCAAVLHDAVEDSNGVITLEVIQVALGYEIARLVDLVTKRKGEQYFDYIRRCIADEQSRAIKRADLADNMRDIDPSSANWTKYVKVLTMIGELATAEKEVDAAYHDVYFAPPPTLTENRIKLNNAVSKLDALRHGEPTVGNGK